MISTVDYMVAAGNEHGVVTVFQIPKSPPDSLPNSLKPKQKKQVNYKKGTCICMPNAETSVCECLAVISFKGGKVQHKWLA